MNKVESDVEQALVDWHKLISHKEGEVNIPPSPVGIAMVYDGHIAVLLSHGASEMPSEELWQQHYLPTIWQELAAGRLPVGLVVSDAWGAMGQEPGIWAESCPALLERAGVSAKAIKDAVKRVVQDRQREADKVIFAGPWDDSVLN